MDLGLKDKVALVTAASRGLGFALAHELVSEGAKVVICGRSEGRLREAVATLRAVAGDDTAVDGQIADLAQPETAQRLVDATVDRYGGLDILVTNAGGPPGGTFEAVDLDAWERGLQLTLMSAVRLARAAMPHLRRSPAASVLTITSISVIQPVPGLHLSNVIRPAVVGLTKALAQELGPAGIRSNSILPGWTATERVEEILAYRAEQNDTSPEIEMAKITADIPLGRLADPAEFARVAAFLVSPAASYVNGVMLQVDGGAYKGLL